MNDLRAALEEIPQGVRPSPGLSSVAGWNRYDTDDEMVLHLWANDERSPGGKSWDIRLPKGALAAIPSEVDYSPLLDIRYEADNSWSVCIRAMPGHVDVERRNVEAAIDGIVEAHNVEHGESCDCPIGLAVEEYEAVLVAASYNAEPTVKSWDKRERKAQFSRKKRRR